MRTALIAVDVQRDFMPGGSLPVPDGWNILPALDRIVPHVDLILMSRDWHPADHCSFSREPEFKDGSWPVHCVQNTPGADIVWVPPLLAVDTAVGGAPVYELVKGWDPNREAYSAFEAHHESGASEPAMVNDYLEAFDIERVVVAGLARDVCVRATALDSLNIGFQTVLDLAASRATTPERGDATAHEVLAAGGALAPDGYTGR